MEQQTAESIEQAIIRFYQTAGSPEQSGYHELITKFQGSPAAWSICWQLMLPEKECNVQFYGAMTLYKKLVTNFNEIPEAMYDELKQKLLDTIYVFMNGPKMVLERLSIALGVFVAKMLHRWPDAIQEIVGLFNNPELTITEAMRIWILMETLSGMAEEGANLVYTSGPERLRLRDEINLHTSFIFNVITQIILAKSELTEFDDDSYTILIKTTKCCSQWVKRAVLTLDEYEPIVTPLLKIIRTCYFGSSYEYRCLEADEAELIESCLDTLTQIMTTSEAHNYENTALKCILRFLEYLCPITAAEWKESNENEDTVHLIYAFFISVIEVHSRLLVKGMLPPCSPDHEKFSILFINEMLNCTNKPGYYVIQESSSILALGFWYLLQDEAFPSDYNIELQPQLRRILIPIYSQLVKILLRKVEYSRENQFSWLDEEVETFRCYRQDISDTFLHSYEVLHEQMLHVMTESLEEAFVLIQSDYTNWPKLEACLYGFYSAAEVTSSNENRYTPRLMQILNEIPYERLNDKVFGTALDTIGAFGEWFRENTTYLPAATALLVRGLNSSVAQQATLGLKDLCRECQIQMRPFAESLLEACQQSLQNGRLRNAEAVRLMFSIGRMMSLLPAERMQVCLDTIVAPFFQDLQAVVQVNELTPEAEERLTSRLKMITSLFMSLNVKGLEDDGHQDVLDGNRLQPVLIVMQNTIGLFRAISDRWMGNKRVAEEICDPLKHALVNLQDDFKPMLQELYYITIKAIQGKGIIQGIGITSLMITIFYNDPDCRDSMQQLFCDVVLYLFDIFALTPADRFSDISDIAEQFYNLCGTVVKKIPAAIDYPKIDCNKLLLHGLQVMALPEMGCIRSAVIFIKNIIMQSRSYPNMTNAILTNGERIVSSSIMCIGVVSPRQQVDLFSDIFLSLNKKYPSEFAVWMKVLATPAFPSPMVSAAEKEQFMKSIIREKANKRMVQGQIKDFSQRARGLVQKMY